MTLRTSTHAPVGGGGTGTARQWGMAGLLLTATVLVHPYLFVFAALLFGAANTNR